MQITGDLSEKVDNLVRRPSSTSVPATGATPVQGSDRGDEATSVTALFDFVADFATEQAVQQGLGKQRLAELDRRVVDMGRELLLLVERRLGPLESELAALRGSLPTSAVPTGESGVGTGTPPFEFYKPQQQPPQEKGNITAAAVVMEAAGRNGSAEQLQEALNQQKLTQSGPVEDHVAAAMELLAELEAGLGQAASTGGSPSLTQPLRTSTAAPCRLLWQRSGSTPPRSPADGDATVRGKPLLHPPPEPMATATATAAAAAAAGAAASAAAGWSHSHNRGVAAVIEATSLPTHQHLGGCSQEQTPAVLLPHMQRQQSPGPPMLVEETQRAVPA